MSLRAKAIISGIVIEGVLLGWVVLKLGGPPKPLWLAALHGANLPSFWLIRCLSLWQHLHLPEPLLWLVVFIFDTAFWSVLSYFVLKWRRWLIDGPR